MAKHINLKRQGTEEGLINHYNRNSALLMNRYTSAFHGRGINLMAIRHHYRCREICSHPSEIDNDKRKYYTLKKFPFRSYSWRRLARDSVRTKTSTASISMCTLMALREARAWLQTFGRVNVASSSECPIIHPS